MTRLLTLLFFAGALLAQPAPDQVLYFYDGSANLEYVCTADSRQPLTTLTVTGISNANPAVVTVTGHGLGGGAAAVAPTIQITGATGNWTPINGVWKVTITGANTFTIPVNSTSFSTLTGSLYVTTRAARTSSAAWAVQRYFYDGSANLIGSGWAVAAGGAGSTSLPQASVTSRTLVCDSRTAYAYQ